MPCFKAVDAWRSDNGQIRFHDDGKGVYLQVPCGQCIGCRLERSRQWAMRCVHEASCHRDNCFITLTYNAENIPPDGGLRKSHFQKFMKRLRKNTGIKIRYYHCGEYGDRNSRPHYHAILFGYDFDDCLYLFDGPGGEPIYTSPTLEKIWGHGFVTIGRVTFESAGYVSRYCMKKINGNNKDIINEKTGLKPYERINQFTGEITEVLPEYSTMSRRPGIGHHWITNYTRDCYPKDFVTIRGSRMRPPKYYDQYLKNVDPDLHSDIKERRELQAYHSGEYTKERIIAKEIVKKAQFEQLKRTI